MKFGSITGIGVWRVLMVVYFGPLFREHKFAAMDYLPHFLSEGDEIWHY